MLLFALLLCLLAGSFGHNYGLRSFNLRLLFWFLSQLLLAGFFFVGFACLLLNIFGAILYGYAEVVVDFYHKLPANGTYEIAIDYN